MLTLVMLSQFVGGLMLKEGDRQIHMHAGKGAWYTVYDERLVEVPDCLAGVGHLFSHVQAPVAPPPSAAAATTLE